MRLRVRALVAALLSLAFVAEIVPAELVQTLGSSFGAIAAAEARSVGALSTTTLGVAHAAQRPQRIPVTLPPRVRPSLVPANVIRPKAAPAVRVGTAVRVPGPPMLRASEIDRVLSAAHRSSAARHVIAPKPLFTVPPITGRASLGTRHTASLPSDPNASGTGINRWWRYQEESIPGGGHAMINVGTGNLLVQDDDMLVPHKGIAMAFRRSYNSQSQHNMSGGDLGQPGMYGNGWTNTFDAHMVKTTLGHFAVYDIDGARYDYHTTGFNPGVQNTLINDTAGDYNQLVFDGGCGMIWTKKSGTIYYFWAPRPASSCPALNPVGGYSGRLYQIIGRNRNTYLTFQYSWDNGDASTSGKVNTIAVQSESGLTTTLSFADVNGYRLLQQLTYPDGATSVSYSYDTLGNLVTVSHPPNNATGSRPLQSYGYRSIGSDSILWFTMSPRLNAACAAGDCQAAGGQFYVGFAGSSAASSTVVNVLHVGVVNPTVPDTVSTGPIQSGPATNLYTYDTEYFGTGVTTPTFSDTDGHMTNWVVDGLGRPTQTQECTASGNQGQQCTGTWLITNESWDANNNLTSKVDSRGYETDYAYDGNGNTLAVAKPPTHLADGYFRPTAWYVYDAFNNVVAYCDPHATHQLGGDWASGTSAASNPCNPSTAYAHRFAYQYPAQEPYGQLITATDPATPAAPAGYQRSYAYSSSSQGGSDFGLPTTVTGGTISNDDGTTVTPQQSLQYDANGNLTSYNTGSGSWSLSYDALGRLTSATDPDNIASYKSYFPDGSLMQTQSAAQHAAGGGPSFTYDLDGNVATETHAYANTTGVTKKFYDGADRLVEVQMPQDATADCSSAPWLTRYFYDLSGGGAAGGVPYNAQGVIPGYGNLVVTQGYVGAQTICVSPQWRDIRATAFDALDRKTNSYEAAFGTQPKETLKYDGTDGCGIPADGELRELDRPTGEIAAYCYDEGGQLTNRNYSGGLRSTPNYSAAYDENGNLVTRGTTAFPNETLAYDPMNRLLSDAEPLNSAQNTVSHSYYANGWPATLSLKTTSGSTTPVYTESYRADGKRRTLRLENNQRFAWSYSAAGRLQSQSDPFTGSAINYDPSATAPAPANMMPESLAYDGYGRLSSETMPGGVLYSGLVYDGEDQIQAFTGSVTSAAGGFVGQAEFCLHMSARNEAYADQNTVLPSMEGGASPSPSFCTQSTNVHWLTNTMANGIRLQANQTYEPRSGMVLSALNVTSPLQYDASGRQTVTQTSIQQASGNIQQPFNTIAAQRTQFFDAENRQTGMAISHYTSDSYDGFYDNSRGDLLYPPGAQWPLVGTITYGLGPSGHPLTIAGQDAVNGNPSGTYTWDGDTALLEGGGASPGYINIQDLGLYDLTNHQMFYVYWRNWHGRLIGGHVSGCWDPWHEDGISALHRFNTLGTGSAGSTGAGGGSVGGGTMQGGGSGGSGGSYKNGTPNLCTNLPITQLAFTNVNGDGYDDGFTTFQGARTYDSGLGQWTTPDAYAGDAHDPMSQQPFMWNGNNPYEYSDPSGFEPVPQFGITTLPDGKTVFNSANGQTVLSADARPWSAQDAANGRAWGEMIGTAVGGLLVGAIAGSKGGAIGGLVGDYLGSKVGAAAGGAIGADAGGHGSDSISAPSERVKKVFAIIDAGSSLADAAKVGKLIAKPLIKKAAPSLRQALLKAQKAVLSPSMHL